MNNELTHAQREYHHAKSIAEQSAAEYAMICVKSLIAINAGAFVAVPALVEIFLEGDYLELQIATASFFFVLGLILAIVTAYIAYWNYQAHSHYNSAVFFSRSIIIEEKYDSENYFRLKDWRDKTKSEYDEEKGKYANRVNWTMILGNIVGIASAISFVSGVVIFTISALSQ
ncbi:MAG: hypothetical protein AAFQ22_08050 [Pseudomonadota bacterium]